LNAKGRKLANMQLKGNPKKIPGDNPIHFYLTLSYYIINNYIKNGRIRLPLPKIKTSEQVLILQAASA